jgi:hypothetical protein
MLRNYFAARQPTFYLTLAGAHWSQDYASAGTLSFEEAARAYKLQEIN